MELFWYGIISGGLLSYITFILVNRRALQIYRTIIRGRYNIILVEVDNPRQLEAARILAKGKMEMDIMKERQNKPDLAVIKGGREDE